MGADVRQLKNLDAQLEAAKLMIAAKPSSLKERAKWFRRHQNGDVIFCVKVQNKVIELQKGKPYAIAGNDKNLPGLIEKIIAAVKGGELDKHIQARVDERRQSKRS